MAGMLHFQFYKGLKVCVQQYTDTCFSENTLITLWIEAQQKWLLADDMYLQQSFSSSLMKVLII